MKPLAAVCRGRGATLLLAFVSLSLCSCLDLESTTCPSGLTCPKGMTCAANQDICIDASPSCGDGIIQASVGEACDDGNILDGDGCSQDCRSDEECGNGRVDKGEVCDDGNKVGGDRCSADCRSDEQCGNRVVDLATKEVCDDGNNSDGDKCSANCRSDERCGNGVIDIAIGEVCDDGNTEDEDGCSADCRSGEQCGNGIQDRGEQCDPGPNGPTLKCNGDCTIAWCGDGVPNAAAKEECDDGGDSRVCDHDCTDAVCGDGLVNPNANLPEQCDPGPGAVDGFSPTCNNNCTISRCGDGILNKEAGEQCDKGDGNGKSDCSRLCKIAICGNGIREDGEACDDGNTQACGQCNATCSVAQPASKATGRIKTVPEAAIADKNGFSISDGMGYPVIFEFDKGGGVSNGHVPVHINKNASAAQVAEAILGAIEASPWNLEVSVDHPNGTDYVTIEHVLAGPVGNQSIMEDVGASGFTVTGMAGGQGKDCTANVGCTNDGDCAPGLSCEKDCAPGTDCHKGLCKSPPWP